MASEVFPPVASFNWPPSIKFFDRFPTYLGAVFTVCNQLSTIFNSDSSILSMVYAVGTFLAITAHAWIILMYNRTRYMGKLIITHLVSKVEVIGDSQEAREALSQRIEGETVIDVYYECTEQFTDADSRYLITDDAEYAEEIQFHEALLAAMFNSTMAENTSSVEGPELEISSQIFCEICLENRESWNMFRNDKCSHSFCYDCTTNHILSKIRDKIKTINCPGVNCKATLNFDACRLIIPEEALVQWDELLCLSLIPEAYKLYCPFRDCSIMLINDHGGMIIKEVKCVACKRSFCAECRVPWHSDFTCKEFQKLYLKKKGKKDEKIVKTLAKKKNWQKCPKCKMYVEKSEGCLHITCRCKYEFCYRCGSKWNENHGKCKQKS